MSKRGSESLRTEPYPEKKPRREPGLRLGNLLVSAGARSQPHKPTMGRPVADCGEAAIFHVILTWLDVPIGKARWLMHGDKPYGNEP